MALFSVPAVCPACGLVFPGGLDMALRSNAEISGNRMPCPRCGAMAVIPDMILEIMQEGIGLFVDEAFTDEVLNALQVAVDDLRHQRKPTKQIVLALARHNKPLSEQFYRWATLGTNFVLAMAAAATAVHLWTHSSSSNRTADEVAVEAFSEIYEEQQDDLRPGDVISQLIQGQQQVDDQKPNRKARRAERAKKRRNRR